MKVEGEKKKKGNKKITIPNNPKAEGGAAPCPCAQAPRSAQARAWGRREGAVGAARAGYRRRVGNAARSKRRLHPAGAATR